MEYTKKQTQNTIIFTVIVPTEDFNKSYDLALEKLAKEIEIDGFRKGHVPTNIAKANIDPSIVSSQAADECIRKNWFEIAEKENVEAVSQPQIEVLKMAKGNDFEFKVEVEILPEIKLPDYKAISKSIEIKKSEVSEKEIEDSLNWLIQSRAKFSQKSGKAEKDDLIEIAYQAPDIEGEKEKNDRFVLGKGHYIKGLEDSLIGLKQGEKKEIEVNNPKNEKEKIMLSIEVKSLQKMELPKLDDEFVKSVGFKTIDELKDNIQKSLLREKEISEKQKTRTEVLEKISKEVKIDVPRTLIQRETDALMDNLKNRVSYELGMKFEDYLKQVSKTEDQTRSEFEKIAIERVKGYLILHAIEKQEKIEVSDKELNDKIDELASQYPNKEEAKKEMQSSNARFYVEDEIKRDKIFNILGC